MNRCLVVGAALWTRFARSQGFKDLFLGLSHRFLWSCGTPHPGLNYGLGPVRISGLTHRLPPPMVLPLQGSGAGDLRLPPNETKPHKYSSTKPASWTSLHFCFLKYGRELLSSRPLHMWLLLLELLPPAFTPFTPSPTHC